MQANTKTTMQSGFHITEDSVLIFENFLRDSEKSKATIEKYVSAVRRLMDWLAGREVSHELLIKYRDILRCDHAATTVNGLLSAINSYLDMTGLSEYRLKFLKIQRRAFRSADREITKEEYFRLIKAARGQGRERLLLIMETICSTGIRVSEIEYITLEALDQGYAEVTLKGKTRTIFIPKKLRKKLRKYAQNQKIVSGRIFLTRNGTPVSRKQIWSEMKSLCETARVKASKIFPHNLRHLFAQCFYKETKDVVKLADMLGHSSVETTRIYLATAGDEHARVLDRLKLVT